MLTKHSKMSFHFRHACVAQAILNGPNHMKMFVYTADLRAVDS